MIDELNIIGFKSFAAIKLNLKKLNIFVGLNGAGKSSVIQTLLMLRQSADSNNHIDELNLTGKLYAGGTARELVREDANRTLEISLKMGSNLTKLKGNYDGSNPNIRTLKLETALHNLQGPLFSNTAWDFIYLNAERIGPRVSYEVPKDRLFPAGMLGMQGEFSSYRLSSTSDPRSEDSKILWSKAFEERKFYEFFLSEGNLKSLSSQTGAFLDFVVPGSSVSSTEESSADSSKYQFEQGNIKDIRAINTGFGLTYTLPVIIAGLAVRPEGLLIVENPEAHLHPRGQSRIGRVLAAVAGYSAQTLIETHSDHVLNGIRLAVKEKIIAPEDVAFHFFNKPPKSDQSDYTSISIDANGELSDWPEFFFDQIQKDLSKL